MSIFGFVGKKVAKKAVGAAAGYMLASGNAEKLINAAGEVVVGANNKVMKLKSAEEVVEKQKHKHYLMICQGVKTLDYVIDEINYADYYDVTDLNGKIKYRAEGDLVLGKHYFTIADGDGKILGNIDKKMVPPIELFEHKPQETVLSAEDGWKLTIRTYHEFDITKLGLGEMQFEFQPRGSWRFTTNKNNDYYRIYCSGKCVASLNKVASTFADRGFDRYVLGYDDLDVENGSVMLSIAIDILLHGTKTEK